MSDSHIEGMAAGTSSGRDLLAASSESREIGNAPCSGLSGSYKDDAEGWREPMTGGWPGSQEATLRSSGRPCSGASRCHGP